MAQCKLTPREFIGNAFSPQIGAVCSNIAESVCQKNNLSFIELLQPFCNLNTEGHFKDPQGTTVAVRNLRLSIQDIHAQPPEPSVARKMLNDSVSLEPCERVTVVTIANVDLEIPLAVPWFEAWREMFLAVQFPSDHEFTKHFLACMIVVSTGDENPLEKIQQMATQLHQSVPGKLPKWFNNNALRYYVLIHDSAQDDRAKAEAVFTEMKNLYDANNCFLLQMNSRPPGHADDNTHLPDPWSQFLVKHTDFNASSDHSSSPRTPADMGGVSAMPNEVTTEPDKSSHAGTPIAPQNPALLSPDIADKLSLSSEISEGPNMHVEMGQEAVPVTIHPLSPEGHRDLNAEIGRRSSAMGGGLTGNSESTPINANVWADSPNHPVPQHGSRLSTQDLDRLRNMINEFCLKSLLPYVEKQIGLLSDVISNKKGVSRSLFSATKRWFGTTKPGAPGSAPTNAVIYTSESPELQLRRLGDLCFMFGHYTLAYQAYHSAKRDFAADQAWLYYAGALEMAALSAFMQGEMSRKTIEYMDDAILTYSNSCKMPQFATRATLLSAECLKARNLHGEAAKQLIRMTSEDSDLRSALLLEQAAYCFISPRMIHKYAFHAVLAGHRFSKSGQRKHSLRCYQQAYQVYRNRGWSSAEDHIHFTIGRQAASLKQVGDAVRAFEKLLNESSRQPSVQQAAFLREFLHTHHLLLQESTTDRSEIPILPLPLVNGNEIQVLLGFLPMATDEHVPASNVSFEKVDEDDSRWTKLEEVIVAEAQGSASMIFKPTIALYTNRTNNSLRPNAVLDEPINLSIELYNPMKISIPLTKVKLLWCFSSGDEGWSNERTLEESTESMPVDTEILESVVLQPSSRRRIVLSCTPRRTGDLKIKGISYNLSNPPTSDQLIVNPTVAVTGKRIFQIKGPRLKNVKEKPGTNMYGVDNRLEINVVDRSPLMKVTFTKISQEMLCGEMQKLDVVLENVGQAPLKNIHVGSTNPKLFCLENNSDKSDGAVTKIILPDGTSLQPGSKHTMAMWIRAPHVKGNHRLDLLFYWENVDSKSTPKYRLCRHTWQLTVLDSIQINAIARRSAVRKSDLPTLTLTVRVKNTNQSNDPFMNEISLERVSLESKAWSLLECITEPSNIKIQSQETYSVLLKLVRKIEESSTISDISLIKKLDDTDDSVERFPYINFIQKRHIKPQAHSETLNENQFRTVEEPCPLAVTTRLDATLILRWRAKITESGNSARHAVGQHHVDLAVVNKSYKQPEDRRSDQNDYSTRLKIFGPDRNVSDSTTIIKKDDVPESEYLKNIVSFSMNHVREGKHNFDRSRMCIVTVNLHLQNHSESRIDVRIDTIGTSSQTSLPSLKTQLYSPQASTFFRYVSHTAVKCQVDALGVNTIKLQAIIPSPGTYDLSSRLEVSARVANTGEFVLQKWRMESACSISHSSV